MASSSEPDHRTAEADEGPSTSTMRESPFRSADVEAGSSTVREARWRLLLGASDAAERTATDTDPSLAGHDLPLAHALDALYAPLDARESSRSRLLRRLRSPSALKGLPEEACRIAREDALGEDGLRALLGEPDRLTAALLRDIEPTAPVVAKLLRVAETLPEATRAVLKELVEALTQRIHADVEGPLHAAASRRVPGPTGRGQSGRRPDLLRTLRHNLRHYDRGTGRIGIERLIFRNAPRAAGPLTLIIALDSSGSMEEARIHGALHAAALARLPDVSPRLLLFDTRVVDVTAHLHDPVEMILRTRLGGGTNLGNAVSHVARLVEVPSRTLVVLISDFEAGGSLSHLVTGLRSLAERGVGLLCLQPAPERSSDAQSPTWIAALEDAGFAVRPCTPEDIAGELTRLMAERRAQA